MMTAIECIQAQLRTTAVFPAWLRKRAEAPFSTWADFYGSYVVSTIGLLARHGRPESAKSLFAPDSATQKERREARQRRDEWTERGPAAVMRAWAGALPPEKIEQISFCADSRVMELYDSLDFMPAALVPGKYELATRRSIVDHFRCDRDDLDAALGVLFSASRDRAKFLARMIERVDESVYQHHRARLAKYPASADQLYSQTNPECWWGGRYCSWLFYTPKGEHVCEAHRYDATEEEKYIPEATGEKGVFCLVCAKPL